MVREWTGLNIRSPEVFPPHNHVFLHVHNTFKYTIILSSNEVVDHFPSLHIVIHVTLNL